MVGWHYRLDGHEFEQSLQSSLFIYLFIHSINNFMESIIKTGKFQCMKNLKRVLRKPEEPA